MRSNGSYGAKTQPRLPSMIADVMTALGVPECRALPDDGGQAGWGRYRFLKSGEGETPVPVLLLEHKIKTISDAKRQVSGIFHCIALLHLKSSYSLFLKSGESSTVFSLDNSDACEQIRSIITSGGFASATSSLRARLAIKDIIKNIPTATKSFNNRGVFSTHYLKGRLLEEHADLKNTAGLEAVWERDPRKSLKLLGWTHLEERNGVYRSRDVPRASILVVGGGVS